ncbi:hypothetical protein CTI12_AA291280 [Artemisia annua]|uniref:Uncharacterized protein n=1 Tax=Artemisia annua TaxID=35608 RepID=A0A2U1N9I3_ARTAN|nr:hypothetical protein CTI12_AA291280 [Artemisia annua]
MMIPPPLASLMRMHNLCSKTDAFEGIYSCPGNPSSFLFLEKGLQVSSKSDSSISSKFCCLGLTIIQQSEDCFEAKPSDAVHKVTGTNLIAESTGCTTADASVGPFSTTGSTFSKLTTPNADTFIESDLDCVTRGAAILDEMNGFNTPSLLLVACVSPILSLSL